MANDALKMIEIWESWKPCLDDLGEDATILNAMNEYGEWKSNNLNQCDIIPSPPISDKKINKFIKETKELLINENIGNNYCIIIYVSRYGIKKVKFIYKSIYDFEKKIINDLKKIEKGLGIDFHTWFFD